MSPTDRDDVLQALVERSFTSTMHARLRLAISHVEERGKKRGHKNLLAASGRFDRKAVLGVLSNWIFTYNAVGGARKVGRGCHVHTFCPLVHTPQVEATLLFAGIIVCLCAIMYQAIGVSGVYYQSSKDLVTAAVMIVIPCAIVYFVACVATEIYILINESKRVTRRGGKTAGSANAAGSSGEVSIGMNPMMLGSAGVTAAGASGAAASIADMPEPPPSELWNIFRTSFVDMQSQLRKLTEEHVALKQRAAVELDSSGGLSGGFESPTARRTKRAFSQVDLTRSAASDGRTASPYSTGTGEGGIAMTSVRKLRGSSGDGERPARSISIGNENPTALLLPGGSNTNPLLRSKSRRGLSVSGTPTRSAAEE